MTTVLLVLFCLSFGCIFYIFAGYPALMALLARLRPRPLKLHDGYMPSVAFVMAVHNEEGNIETRLQNYQDLDYPRHLLSFHIGSDASTDATDDIIERFRAKDSTIHLTRYDRCGKTKIIFELADALKEDIIIFTDADDHILAGSYFVPMDNVLKRMPRFEACVEYSPLMEGIYLPKDTCVVV